MQSWIFQGETKSSRNPTLGSIIQDNFKGGRIEEGLATRGKHYPVDWSDEEVYSQKRKDKALWASGNANNKGKGKSQTVMSVDAKLRPEAGRVWQNASDEEKDAAYLYTWTEYRSMNRALRKGEGLSGDIQLKVRGLTNLIKDSSLKTDMWVQRGVEASVNMFGLDFNTITPSDIAKLEGSIVQDKGFVSCGIAEWRGMIKRM